jgi:hypothetical protein
MLGHAPLRVVIGLVERVRSHPATAWQYDVIHLSPNVMPAKDEVRHVTHFIIPFFLRPKKKRAPSLRCDDEGERKSG